MGFRRRFDNLIEEKFKNYVDKYKVKFKNENFFKNLIMILLYQKIKF
jgi:hypothetical protein